MSDRGAASGVRMWVKCSSPPRRRGQGRSQVDEIVLLVRVFEGDQNAKLSR